MKKHVYFQFPLFLIRKMHTDPDLAYREITTFALVDFALKQLVTPEDAARQLLYNWLRGGGLSDAIKAFKKKKSNKLYTNNIEWQDWETIEYCFFSAGGDREELIYDLIKLFNDDDILLDLAIQNCQLQKINSFFSVTGPNPDNRLKYYKEIKAAVDQHEVKNGSEPRPTILSKLFFDLVKEPELFTCYMAIRSLEGRRKFTATNRPTIAGRMAGYKSVKLLPENDKVYQKFNNSRYHFDKLIKELISRSLIKSILRQKAWSRFYISTKLTPTELGTTIGEQRKKKNMKIKNDEAKQAYLNAYNKTM